MNVYPAQMARPPVRHVRAGAPPDDLDARFACLDQAAPPSILDSQWLTATLCLSPLLIVAIFYFAR